MGLHLGQRKLLLTEVNFLTNYSDLSKNIIYIGAAPGHHIEFLSTLFLIIRFICMIPEILQLKKQTKY
jgi:hypothetical protein